MAYEIHGGAAARSRSVTKIRNVACHSNSVLEKYYGERLWLVGKCTLCDSSDTKNSYLQDCACAVS